jgi:Nuclease-related domain
VAVLGHMPRQPWLYTGFAAAAITGSIFRFIRTRRIAARLRLGRDGERVVGEFLERLRSNGAQVFHDIPGDSFNLDHVVLSTRGLFVIETKTRKKPVRGDARIKLMNNGVLVGGYSPERNPVEQVQAGAQWLENLLRESTGRQFAVRGVVLYPGWFVEPMTREWRSAGLPWVLEPKSLPAFLAHEPQIFSEDQIRLAAFHLSRYVRSKQAEQSPATTN